MTRLDGVDQDVFVELVTFLDLPTEEMVVHNADDSYTIFVNANIAQNRQVEAVEHAMRHIRQNDFEKVDVQEIEAKAHRIEVETQPVPKTKRRRRKYWEMTKEERRKRVNRIIRRQIKYLQEKYSHEKVERYHQLCNERMLYDEQFFNEHNIFW